jgi:hypothetical protein
LVCDHGDGLRHLDDLLRLHQRLRVDAQEQGEIGQQGVLLLQEAYTCTITN